MNKCNLCGEKTERGCAVLCDTCVRANKPISAILRKEIIERDGGKCMNCGATENIHIDHIIPYSEGGTKDKDNLQLLCLLCNSSKGYRSQEVFLDRWKARKVKIVKLHDEGMGWADIGRKFCISRQRAQQIYQNEAET